MEHALCSRGTFIQVAKLMWIIIMFKKIASLWVLSFALSSSVKNTEATHSGTYSGPGERILRPWSSFLSGFLHSKSPTLDIVMLIQSIFLPAPAMTPYKQMKFSRREKEERGRRISLPLHKRKSQRPSNNLWGHDCYFRFLCCICLKKFCQIFRYSI